VVQLDLKVMVWVGSHPDEQEELFDPAVSFPQQCWAYQPRITL